MSATQLGMFAKFWQAGRVKTRLATAIGDEAASEVYRTFVTTLLARFENVGSRRVLAFWPLERLADFAGLVSHRRWALQPQSDGDLGTRMRSYFELAFAEGTSRAVLIGSDSPTLPREHIDRAFELLERHSVVLGPSDDGGYYLVGLSGQVPPIFEGIAWSTAGVWDATLARLKAAAVDFATLPPWYDVDDAEDLRRLGDELRRTPEIAEELTELRRVVYAALSAT